LLPGDAEHEKYQQRLQQGIEIDDTSWRQLAALESLAW
jgi:uncharacterized oxidoreductase